jgi:hypothetical protein
MIRLTANLTILSGVLSDVVLRARSGVRLGEQVLRIYSQQAGTVMLTAVVTTSINSSHHRFVVQVVTAGMALKTTIVVIVSVC